MKPHVICHMAISIDGRTLPSRWRPQGAKPGGPYDRAHEQLQGDAWLIGRTTGQEFARGSSYPDVIGETFPREPWFARRDASGYGIVLDTHGKIAWGRADIGGDPIVAVLTEQVSDAHLAGLRSGVSYLFAGKMELDLRSRSSTEPRARRKRLLLEGGGMTNGAFLRAGLVDESASCLPVHRRSPRCAVLVRRVARRGGSARPDHGNGSRELTCARRWRHVASLPRSERRPRRSGLSGAHLDKTPTSEHARCTTCDGGGVRRQPRPTLTANDSYDAAPTGAVGVHVSPPAQIQERRHVTQQPTDFSPPSASFPPTW